MNVYRQGVPEQQLADWPPPAEREGNRLVDGNPQASGRLDLEAEEGRRQLGVWRCEPGVFECVEQADELQTILEGRLRLVEADGTTHDLGPGDTVFTRQGERLTWDVRETVVKVFYAVRHAPG